jgi:tRNA-dihydrouridine synthase A
VPQTCTVRKAWHLREKENGMVLCPPFATSPKIRQTATTMSNPPATALDRRFAVAPMMDWTTRHCRAFHRVLTKGALLYTEMVTAEALIHGDPKRLIGFDGIEHPVALQIGGSDPDKLAQATRIGASFGYDEINLNVGCPSDRVQSGRFGACLMREPTLVAECLSAMREATTLPVTVKNRLGVDDQEPRESLFAFTETVAKAGVDVFIVHARKAWLKGLSPKDNREIPPLDYEIVRDLKRAHPNLIIILNGGLETLAQVKAEMVGLDGVMLGRAAYHDPALLGKVDRDLLGMGTEMVTPEQAFFAFRPYVEARLSEGVPLHAMTRHMLGLFMGRAGARLFRRTLSEHTREGAGLDVYDSALEVIMRETERARLHLQRHVA